VQQLIGDRAGHVDLDVPLGVRAHPAPRGRAVRLHQASRSTTPATRARSSSDSSRSTRPTRSVDPGIRPGAHLEAQERACGCRVVRPHGEHERPRRAPVRRDLRRLPAFAAARERLRLRRPHRQTVYLFRAFPHVADTYRRRFRHILVDEYQDTNHAQYALIHELTRPIEDVGALLDETDGASLTVVGDSDQSIYAFRGADIRNITEFERDYPGAKVVLLEQNYRSTQNILTAANAVISNNFDRKDKKLWTDVGAGDKIVGFTGYSQHDEAQFVADEVEALHRAGMPYGEMAVFYRTNSQSRALEEIFIRSAVPYKIMGGTKFYERAEIKDALAYLIAVANPADELSVRRILNRRAAASATSPRPRSRATRPRRTSPSATRSRTRRRWASGPRSRPRSRSSTPCSPRHRHHAARLGRGAAPTAVAEGLNVLLNKSGYLDALRGRRTRRTRPASRTSTSSSPSPASSPATTPTAPRLPHRGRARLGRR
jgi:hypothetical protein